MGTPIRDRGIRWQETYGDKSKSLKEGCEEQIGPGSYFRWEGHDSSTSTDYYVVVAPGYSEKGGYHFFAGLRKMPEEHGASGKKFKTQREALSYAFKTWRVPPPATKPAKAYSINDVAGKSIILEGTHEAAGKAGLKKVGMSLAGAGGSIQWNRRIGPKVLAEMYCFAYKASKCMGFMAGLYSRLRLMGVDGMNMPSGQKGQNEFFGGQGPLPKSPQVATCESPQPDVFSKMTSNPIPIQNKLMFISRKDDKKTGRAVSDVEYKNPFAPREGQKHVITRLREVPITPRVSYGAPPPEDFLNALAAQGIVGQPLGGGKAHSILARKEYRFQVTPDKWDAFKAAMSQSGGHVFELAGEQKNLVDLMEYRKATGQSIEQDLDKPYFESVWLQGSQLMVYDADTGMPMGLQIQSQARTEKESASSQEASNVKYILKNPLQLISQWGDKNLGSLVMQRDEAEKAGQDSTAIKQQVLAAIGQIMAAKAVAPASFEDASPEEQQAMIAGFRELASHGGVSLSPEMFADSRTCAPQMDNVEVVVPAVDGYLLPLNAQDNLATPQDLEGGLAKTKVPYCPNYKVDANWQQVGDEQQPAARRFDLNKGWVYGPLPEGVQPSQQFDGTRVACRTTMHCAQADGSLGKIDNGEWLRYNANSAGSFVPGPLYDVALSPEYASSKRTDRHLVNRMGQNRNGWVVNFEEHPLKYSNGEVQTARQHGGKAFLAADPLRNKEAYEADVDGKPYDLSQHAFRQGDKVFFKDNWAAYQFMKKHLGLSDEEIGPFTRVTDADLRIIDDIATDAIQYYEQNKNPQQQPGQELDQEKFSFGRVCSQCGGGTAPPEVLRELSNALRNPEQAFQPKKGVLWSIKYQKPQGEMGWLQDLDGEAVLFGAQSQAEKAMGLPQVKEIAASGAKIWVEAYAQDAMMVPSFAKRQAEDPTAQLTYSGDRMSMLISQYDQIGWQQEQQEQAQEAEAPMEPEVLPEAQPQEVAVGPEATMEGAPQAEPIMPPAEQAPIPGGQPMPVPEETKAPGPGHLITEDELRRRAEEARRNMQAESLARLTRLADHLDEGGRHAEANAIDRIIRMSS